MHQRTWKALIAGGAALTVGLTLTAFGAPSHAEGVAGITSEARAQDEVMNYAVNLPKNTDKATFERAAAQASFMGGLVLARYPKFGTFFVQSASPPF